jgi:hypothetical protein
MNNNLNALKIITLFFAACQEETDPDLPGGELRMGVVGQDDAGLYYRLRDATFQVQGPDSFTVDTEFNPTTDVFSLTVSAGPYDVVLEDGWRIERWDPISDATLDVPATLISENPVSTVVSGSETASVVFVFNVPDAGPVVLGPGDLEIDIDIETTPPLIACDPLVQDCPGGQGCYPDFVDGYLCANAGGIGVYGECQFINDCAPNLACVNSSANSSCNQAVEGCCIAFCDVSFPSCPGLETCISLGIGDPNVGLCAAF